MSDFHSYFQETLEDGSVIYTFYSDLTKRIYKVNFDPSLYSEFAGDFPVLLSDGHVVGIYNKITQPGIESQEDSQVADTIIEIISSYLHSLPPEAVILYHCDTNDEKQSYRHVLFESWFEKANVKDKIIKEVVEVDLPAVDDKIVKHYLGFLILKTNPNASKVLEEFNVFCYFMI